MNNTALSGPLIIGWDVGDWNCDNNPKSRDAIVILNPQLSGVGKPCRGNLRACINNSTDTRALLTNLFILCSAEPYVNDASVILAIDASLCFSIGFVELIGGLGVTKPVESSESNPYLYRQTERYLFKLGLKPLSPIKDMIGSQATKAIHVLARFAPQVKRCGVWGNGDQLTIIDAYPSACKQSTHIESLRQQVSNCSPHHQDEQDALTCALIASLFAQQPEALLAPDETISAREGWIWVPRDISQGRIP